MHAEAIFITAGESQQLERSSPMLQGIHGVAYLKTAMVWRDSSWAYAIPVSIAIWTANPLELESYGSENLQGRAKRHCQ